MPGLWEKDYGVLDTWVYVEVVFDFSKLNTLAMHLNLIVLSPYESKSAIGALLDQVTRFIESASIRVEDFHRSPFRIPYERFGCPFPVAKVASCQRRALNKKLSHATEWYQPIVIVWVYNPQACSNTAPDIHWARLEIDA